jgi:oxygen-dependent protoporphyrinogen oxidase
MTSFGVERAASPAADVVVVGGGVAGLVVARGLAIAGRSVTILESAERVGGSVAPHDVAGITLDAGAESFATRTTAVADLLAELGLADAVVLPRPGGAWLQLRGRALPLPATGVLGIPGRAWARDVRAVVGVTGAARAALDRALPARWGTAPGTSLGRLVRLRMGRRVRDRLVAPVVRGVHSADPEELDADIAGLRAEVRRTGSLAAAAAAARSAEPAGSAVAGTEGGMHRLVTALIDDAVRRGARVRTGTPVSSVARGEDGWLVTLGRSGQPGAAEVLRARDVVLAVPGPVLGRLLTETMPDLLPGPAPRPAARVVLVTLVVDVPALDAAPRGTGVLVADGAEVSARALTHATAKWAWLARAAGPGRHVLRLSYGPAAGIDGIPMHAVAAEDLTERARADAAHLLGVPIPRRAVVATAGTVWPGGMPAVGPMQRQWSSLVADALDTVDGLWVTGSWYAGTGLAAVVAHARATTSAVVAARP